jgi:flagellar motor protein MotB
VRDFLVAQGAVDKKHTSVVGMGEREPLYPDPEAPEELHKLNRRVEVSVACPKASGRKSPP